MRMLETCQVCETKSVRVFFEPTYNGYRGTCTKCDTNFAMS